MVRLKIFSITTTFNCYQEHTSSPILEYHHHCHHYTQCISLIGTMIGYEEGRKVATHIMHIQEVVKGFI